MLYYVRRAGSSETVEAVESLEGAASSGGGSEGGVGVRGKITFDALQIIKQFPACFAQVQFPVDYLNVLTWVGTIVGLEFPQLMPADCFQKLSHDSYMVMYTIFFTLVNFLLAAWWCCTFDKKHKAAIFEIILVGNFFIYSGMSNVIFSTFPCVDFDYGDKLGTVSLLRADLGIDCDSDDHFLAQYWAGLMAILYPVGVPLVFYRLLSGNRDRIMNAATRDTDEVLAPIRFLFTNYAPHAWYYEPVVCLQKLVLVGMVVFFWPGSLAQLAVAQASATVFLSVYSFIQPFRGMSVNLHAVSAQFCICFIVLAAILICASQAVHEASGGVDSNYDSGTMAT